METDEMLMIRFESPPQTAPRRVRITGRKDPPSHSREPAYRSFIAPSPIPSTLRPKSQRLLKSG
ncbi:hypothetical protein GCM10010219_42890 [Streptomyces netropsis]|nr:hypothetical protein GCM10010219_42890 [Streptomyces netropsis]